MVNTMPSEAAIQAKMDEMKLDRLQAIRVLQQLNYIRSELKRAPSAHPWGKSQTYA